jgi:8-oxo-dGTP pyrophosphatase MutT (NUDIX family)
MPMSEFIRDLRGKIGTDLLLLPSATGAVFDGEGRMLLLRHANGGVWVTPGGAIEPDEAPAEAVVREVWEETGLEVEPVRLLGAYGGPEFRVRYENGDQVAFVIIAFECRVLGGSLRLDGEEALELRYVAADELASLQLAPWARSVLPELARAGAGRSFLSPRWRPPRREA